MSEQLTLEGGAPVVAATETIPTFGDLPESSTSGPRISFVDDAPEPEPEIEASPTPESAPVSPPAVEFAPPPAVAPSGPGVAQELFQAMAALDDYKEQKQRAEQRARESREWKPPELTEQQAEEMLTDREKFRAGIAARDAWHRNSSVEMVKPLAEKIQSLEAQLQDVNYRQHTEAWNDVRDVMQEKGVNADAYYGPIMTALQQNPATYWQIAKNPDALKTAVEMLHQKSGPSTFAAPPQEPKSPPTVGQPAKAPSKKDADGSNFNHPAIEQAEKVFGKKFTPQMRAEFQRTIREGRA